MPPTVKDSSTLPSSPENSERPSQGASAGQQISTSQPVTLEVPVTVNGARAVEGSDKREPFSETTSTVLVLVNGAVIRLSSAVAPGQLLFLTNEKTKKEVVCQVVKSKNYGSTSGYVELEFTEPVLGFWGMRFPGERSAIQANASLSAARKLDSAASPAGTPVTNAEQKPALVVDAKPVENITTNLADAVQEFKTEIKADSRPSSKADFLAPAEASTGGLTLDANRLEDQLSALLSAEQKQTEGTTAASVSPVLATPSKRELGDAAAKIFEMASEEPVIVKVDAEPAKLELSSPSPAAQKIAPTAARSSFDDEEMKIPAWLEPLARNAAIPAPLSENDASSDSTTQFEQAQAPAPVAAPKQTTTATKAKNAGITRKRPPAAPLFGNSLLSHSTPELTSPRGSGKGLWMGIAAGLILAAAGSAWYFRDSLASLTSANATSGSNAPAVSTAHSASLPNAPTGNSTAIVAPAPNAMADAPAAGRKANSASAIVGAPAPVSSPGQGKVQTAAITERIPKSGSSNDVNKGAEKSAEPIETAAPEITRPSLGKIRLAKPKVARSANVQANGEMEPALEASNSELSGGENSLGANLTESSQPAAPAAPVATGGDVKPAHLLSSAPPSYPALARTQHVAGDVRVDALIDATGRVTTMKVVSGPSLLHQAAMDALRQWKYQAATLDGKPVPMHLTVTIQFRLQ